MMEQKVIVVKNAIKHYKTETQVLNDLNMTVSKGIIYGLLGPSGCGKTTLLSCIVGILRLDKGKIWILGESPGSKGSAIPGPRIGYMPQETSLVDEFTRNDTLYYFGRINGLESDEIETTQKFLSELLQLPPKDHLVRNMSGGQQRRVSLAAALIHKPELLILDEPTVGLDPVLREIIWTYLIKITQDEGVTVLMTTHFIEEAANANKIGLMRHGKLLTESSPQQLLERFQSESLEEVFLTLSTMQENNTLITNTSVPGASESEDDGGEGSYKDKDKLKKHEIKVGFKEDLKQGISRLKVFKALVKKNGTQMLRNHPQMALAILFPIIQVCSLFIGLGMEPRGLMIGIINNEAGNCDYGNNVGNIMYDEEKFACHFENISCRFLRDFGNSIVTQVHYSNLFEATLDIHNGKLVGVMHFNQNFSEALQKRIENSNDMTEEEVPSTEIQIFFNTDRQYKLYLQKKLFERFFEIYEDVMKDCKISPKFASVPIRFEKPVYGTANMNFAVFVAPGMILCILFFMANAISTVLIITDQNEGVWKRSLVQGVTTTEILLAHVLVQIIIVFIHTIMIICMCFPIWGLECKGSIFMVTCLSFLTGIGGLMYGFLISTIFSNLTLAQYIACGSSLILTTLSGVLWPIEGMPKILRWISPVVPLTVPSSSLRAILEKGYSIQESEVYNGFLVMSGWILFGLITCLITLRLKAAL